MMENLDNIVIMKYGVHANEMPEDIIKRKQYELKTTQNVFWGYGGNLCHPINQIKPFIYENKKKNKKTYLILVKNKTIIQSELEEHNIQNRSVMFSEDRISWEPIPLGNNVIGSRYALICSSFEKSNLKIDLSNYRIPFGNSAGQRLSNYLGWRKNKACGIYSEKDIDIAIPKMVDVSIIAEIENAVFVQ